MWKMERWPSYSVDALLSGIQDKQYFNSIQCSSIIKIRFGQKKKEKKKSQIQDRTRVIRDDNLIGQLNIFSKLSK